MDNQGERQGRTEGQPAPRPKNPKRVAAGQVNRAQRGPLTEAGRERLRVAIGRVRPWERATGPRTAPGRGQAARNGKRRQLGPRSVREMRSELAAARSLLRGLQAAGRERESPGSGSPAES